VSGTAVAVTTIAGGTERHDRQVNSWLRQMDAVLAFCSARPNDGGTGAVYVLLKKA